MGLGEFLLPAIAAFWFLTHWNRTRYRVARESGYRLVFESASYGVLFTAGGHVVILLLNRWCPQMGVMLKSLALFGDTGPATLSVLFGFVGPLVLNLFSDKDETVVETAKQMGLRIELLFAESMERRQPVELSLKSRKSYIGYVLEIIDPGQPDVEIIPLASGYRREDTQELEITTHYAPVLREFVESDELEHFTGFRVVIRMSEIVSARLFDLDVYERF